MYQICYTNRFKKKDYEQEKANGRQYLGYGIRAYRNVWAKGSL